MTKDEIDAAIQIATKNKMPCLLIIRKKPSKPIQKLISELFEGFGPFSSFAQRIEASYAFGIITKEEKNDLLIIKKIRNFFAHYPKKISFRNHEFKKLCSTLSRSKSKMPTKKGWRTDTSRVTFLITVGIFVCNANGRMLKNMKHNKSLQAIGTRRQMASNSSP